MMGMRGVAFAGLAAIAGCNQIYGLNDVVVVIDASPEADANDAMLPTARLSRLVAVTLSPSGAPSPTPSIVPVEPAPTIEVGAIDGPLTPTAYRADGTFGIPYELANTPWRLVYTADGQVPHELHWAPAENTGHATIPHLGALDRTPAPPNAELVLTPPNLIPASHSFPTTWTTGSWSEMRMSSVPSATVQYRFDAARVMGVPVGPRLAPAPTKGDRALLVDFEARNTTVGSNTQFCRVSTRSAAFAVELANGPSMDPAPPQMQNNGGSIDFVGFPELPALPIQARIALTFKETGPMSRNYYVGLATNTVLPQFFDTVFGAPLPTPAMVTLAQCLNPHELMSPQPPFRSPIYDRTVTGFTRIAHFQITTIQNIAGVAPVARGMVTAVLLTGDTATVNFEVGIPKTLLLGSQDVTYDPGALMGTDDVPLAAGSGAVALTFDLDEATRSADYYVVTLFKIEGAALAPVRRYTMTARSIPIDRALLVPGGRYVLRVVSFNGAPEASIGDFTTYTLPQSSATAYTRSFVVP